MYNGVNEEQQNIGLEFQDFDFTGLTAAREGCKDTGTDEKKMDCVKNILNAIDFVDPTGVTAMAAALVYTKCDV
jgi:hypothetical protein